MAILFYVLFPLCLLGYQDLGIEEEFYSTKKKVRVSDGIGKGRTKETALQNAIIDARKKALERSTTSFKHFLSESKDGVFVKDSVASEVYAKIIDKEKIIKVTYDHGIDFSPYYVAIVDCEITVSFLDLDFFAQEIMKTAEAACIRSLVLSGWGQFFNRSYFAGSAMFLTTYGSLGYGYLRQTKIADERRAYENAMTTEEAERRYKMLREHRNVANTMYILGFSTWAYSVWEAFEDRERADKLLDAVHKRYFQNFPFERQYSFFQKFMMEYTRPEW
ncbi:MAG: hypothetical protein NZM25_02815 [Leptospiraceae bacterium]|nr:hypothetical protein [Leptospiraceae bacterium]MDW8307200.1 hypothetical protein [Leptospiraceae bacterium]